MAVGRAQIPVDPAVGKIGRVSAQERTLVNELAAEPAPVTISRARGFNGSLHIVGKESPKEESPPPSEELPQQRPILNPSLAVTAEGRGKEPPKADGPLGVRDPLSRGSG